MGMEKVILSGLAKCTKCVGHTRPPFIAPKLPEVINPNELRLCPRFLENGIGDVLELSKSTKLAENVQTVTNGKWVNGKWVKSKALINFKTKETGTTIEASAKSITNLQFKEGQVIDRYGRVLATDIPSVNKERLEKYLSFYTEELAKVEELCNKGLDYVSACVLSKSSRCQTMTTKAPVIDFVKTLTDICETKRLRCHDIYLDLGLTSRELKDKKSIQQMNAGLIAKFIDENPTVDLQPFKEYITSLDKNSLFETAPRLKEMNSGELLEFFKYHFLKGHKNLTTKELSMSNLTEYLSTHKVDSYELSLLLSKFPATNRHIGKLPVDWNVETSVLQQKVEEFFEKFQRLEHRKSGSGYESFACSDLYLQTPSQELASILGKDVKITALDAGKFGVGYKISVRGAKDVVLKIFHENPYSREWYNVHGQYCEPQRGLLLNNISDCFAKFHFGKISTDIEKDGYTITEYLQGDLPFIGKSLSDNLGNSSRFFVFAKDISKKHNLLGGKILEYGDVHIIESSI